MSIVLAAAFVLAFTIVYGAYWLTIVLPEKREERALHDRLKASGEVFAQPAFLKPRQALSAIKPLDWLLTRLQSLVGPVQRLVAHSGVPITAGAFVLAMVFFALVAGFVVTLFSDRALLVAGAAVLAACLPAVYLVQARNARLERFESQFPDAMDLMARSLRAGHALSTALELAGNEIPDPAGAEFRQVYEQQNFGMSLEESLKRMAARVPLLDARFFVTAVLTQREVGGNLSEVLDRLAFVMRERFTVRRQIRVISAHGRITGLVLGFLPFVVAGTLFVIQPDHIMTLFQDPTGIRLVVAAIVLQIIGIYSMKRIINVEY